MYTYTHTRLSMSAALGSTSTCQFPVSNKMDGWRMEIMVEIYPILASRLCPQPASAATEDPFRTAFTNPGSASSLFLLFSKLNLDRKSLEILNFC